MLDYRLIEAFAAVIEEKGFERAAERLHITQSAVSQRVKALEDEVGRILVARESPPRATAAGERLFRHYRQVSGLEEEALGELGMRSEAGFSELPIAVNADSLSVWLMPAITEFLKSRAVTLEILVGDQERTLEMLKSGTVAGCISAQSSPIQGCACTFIGAMRYRLAASPDFALRWFPRGMDRESAAAAPVIHVSRDDQLQYQSLLQLFGEPLVVPPAHYIPSTATYLEAVLDGLGYSLIAEVQASPAIREGGLVELDERARIDVPYYWHRWNRYSTLLEDFSSALLSEGARLLGSTAGSRPLRAR